MKFRLAFLPAFALLAGCAGVTADLDALRDTTPEGSAFEKSLARDYQDLADFEAQKMYDWVDQAYFAQKGLRAARGEQVDPDLVSSRKLSGEQSRDAESQREAMLAVFSEGGRDASPVAAARAQSNFDCWLEQMEEGWQFDHIEACRTGFEQALAQVKSDMAPQPVAATTETPAVTAPPATKRFLVFFDFDSAELSEAARAVLAQAADSHKNGGFNTVITGHADRAGPDVYNVGLSQRRAEAVRGALAQMGLNLDDISLRAAGEDDPLVQTSDGVPEPQNRRVELELRSLSTPVADSSS